MTPARRTRFADLLAGRVASFSYSCAFSLSSARRGDLRNLEKRDAMGPRDWVADWARLSGNSWASDAGRGEC